MENRNVFTVAAKIKTRTRDCAEYADRVREARAQAYAIELAA
jgi:hypothetical protein